jgi:DNA-binding IclR family transcriptional regulator
MQPSSVKSALRVIEILELFRKSREPKAMTEISAELGYPQSSATVLLKTLTVLGYLNYDRRSRRYFPTLQVTSLGEWIPEALFGKTRMLEAMHEVHAETGETVSIGTCNDIYLQYVAIVQSIHAIRFHVDQGTMRLLTKSTLGWLLMSTMPDEKVDNIIRRANIATKDPADRVRVPEMMEKVRSIRGRAYCATENVPFLGGGTICVLLPVTLNGQPAVLGLGGAAERVKQNHNRYVAALQRAAQSVAPTNPLDQPLDIEF